MNEVSYAQNWDQLMSFLTEEEILRFRKRIKLFGKHSTPEGVALIAALSRERLNRPLTGLTSDRSPSGDKLRFSFSK